jgi:flagellar protein FliO/FliZ
MPHSTLYSLLSSVFALAAVLGLILLAARLFRASNLGNKTNQRLGMLASVALDTKRRLILVRADDREFLLLTGGGNDVCVAEMKERAS